MQYENNREVAKISVLSSGKTDEYEYLSGQEILPFDQSRIIEQAKLTYSPLGKAFEKHTHKKNDLRSIKKTNKGIWRAWNRTS